MYSHSYVDDICLLAVGKFPNTVWGFIQWALHTVEIWCDEVRLSVHPDKTGLVVFIRRRKLPGFFEPHYFWGYFTSPYVGQVSLGSPGFSADLEGACGCQSKEGLQFFLIMKANEMHYFSDLFDKVLYMFRTGPLSIIRSVSTLYTRNRYLSF
jgi:hypothetical protein